MFGTCVRGGQSMIHPFFFEVVFPAQNDKLLIGTPDWHAYLAVAGTEEEVECIPDLQWTSYYGHPEVTRKLNSPSD